MVKTVVRAFKWTPDYIDTLFTDDYDYHGLAYWWTDVKEQTKKQ